MQVLEFSIAHSTCVYQSDELEQPDGSINLRTLTVCRPRMVFLSSMEVWKQFGCGTEAIVSMLGWGNTAAEWWDLLTCCQPHRCFFDILSVRFFKKNLQQRFFHQAGRMLRKLYKGVALSNSHGINNDKLMNLGSLGGASKALTIGSLQHLRSGQKRLRPKWHTHSSLLHPSVGNLGVAKIINSLTEFLPKRISCQGWEPPKTKPAAPKALTIYVVFPNQSANQDTTARQWYRFPDLRFQGARFVVATDCNLPHWSLPYRTLKILPVSEDAYVFERMLGSDGI